MFAEEVVKEISLSIQLKLKTYFRTPLACTDECPPVGLATDKMTQKRHTNHLAAFLTPDINALLSDSFLKPVFVGMPVVNKHGGRDIAEQMIKIAESYLSNLEEQYLKTIYFSLPATSWTWLSSSTLRCQTTARSSSTAFLGGAG